MIRRRSGLGAPANDAGFLRAALLGYEQQRSEIESRIAELRRQLGSRAAADTSEALSSDGAAPPRTKRAFSPSARKRIAEAQRKRWAAFRKESAATAAPKRAHAAKRTLSASAKKRIADAARKRWAAFRAKKAQTAAAPKVKTAGA